MKPTYLLPLLISPCVALADPALFCAGTYDVVSGNVTGTAQGSRIELIRTTNDGPATLRYDGCDTAQMTIQGRAMTLTRPAEGADWRAQTPGGGGTLYFRFHVGQPTQMAARMSTTDGTLTVKRGSHLTLLNADDTQPLECFEALDPTVVPQDGSAIGFAQGLGKTPHPDHKTNDYFKTEVTDPGDAAAGVPPSFVVRYPLSLSMEMLPRVADADTFQAVCGGRKLEPVRKILSIKVYPVDPGYTAFARIVDVETSKIEAQAEGQSPADIVAAMQAAYGALGRPVGDMGDVWAD